MNSPIALPWNNAEWNSVDGLLLPALVGVMRLCWIWPWMLFLQGFLSPSVDAALMSPLMVIALPLLGFTFARWAMPTLAERRDFRRTNQVRRNIAASGFAVILFMLWLRFLQQDFGLWDLRWLLAAGYDLLYWDAIPIEIPGTLLFLLMGIFLWLRGALDGHGQYSHEEVWKAFLWGGAALALFAWILPAGVPGGQSGTTANPFSAAGGQLQIPFGCCYLLLPRTGGAGRCQPQEIRWLAAQFTRGQSESQPQLACRHRLTIFVLLGVALLIGLIIQPGDAALLWRALGIIWKGISTVLIWIITVVAYPIFILIEYLIRFLRSLFGDRSQESEAAGIPQPPRLSRFRRHRKGLSKQCRSRTGG